MARAASSGTFRSADGRAAVMIFERLDTRRVKTAATAAGVRRYAAPRPVLIYLSRLIHGAAT